MTVQTLVLAVGVGAALIAMWLYLRFEARAPQSITGTLLHVGGAFLMLQLIPLAERLIVAGSDSSARKLAAVFVVVLPGMTYIWLASIWLIKLAQRSAFRVR